MKYLPNTYPQSNNMIFSKMLSRKRPAGTGCTNDQNEDAEHPVERLFRSIPDRNKYKLEALPPPVKKRPQTDSRGHSNKVEQLIKGMREQFPSLGSTTPRVRGGDVAVRSSVLNAKFNTSKPDDSILPFNHGGCIVAVGTAQRTQLEKPQIPNEDRLGFDPIKTLAMFAQTSNTPRARMRDVAVRNAVPDAKNRGSNSSKLGESILAANHAGRIVVCGTACRKKVEESQVLDEDPLGSDVTEMSAHSSSSEDENTTPLSDASMSGVSDGGSYLRKRTSGTQTRDVISRGTQTLDTISRGTQTQMPHCLDRSEQADSSSVGATPFRFQPMLSTPRRPLSQRQDHNSLNQLWYGQKSSFRASTWPQLKQLHLPSHEDDFRYDQPVLPFATSTPFRFNPQLSKPSSRPGSAVTRSDRVRSEESSSTSSGQTVAEEVFHLSFYMKCKEHTKTPQFDYDSNSIEE